MIDGQHVRAWHQAALTGAAFAGKLPKLDPRLLGKPPRKQTWQEQKALMQTLWPAADTVRGA